MNELNTLELDDQELMDVVGGCCHPCRAKCGPEIAVAIAVAVAVVI